MEIGCGCIQRRAPVMFRTSDSEQVSTRHEPRRYGARTCVDSQSSERSSLVIRRSPMIGNIPPFGSIALFRLHCNAISLRCLEARKREIDADLKAQQGDMEINGANDRADFLPENSAAARVVTLSNRLRFPITADPKWSVHCRQNRRRRSRVGGSFRDREPIAGGQNPVGRLIRSAQRRSPWSGSQPFARLASVVCNRTKREPGGVTGSLGCAGQRQTFGHR
jgi:hypothetical protein